MSYGGLCPVKDIDDTAMAFRLLRLHGYNVSSCKKTKTHIFFQKSMHAALMST
jgi:hypothetical protein